MNVLSVLTREHPRLQTHIYCLYHLSIVYCQQMHVVYKNQFFQLPLCSNFSQQQKQNWIKCREKNIEETATLFVIMYIKWQLIKMQIESCASSKIIPQQFFLICRYFPYRSLKQYKLTLKEFRVARKMVV